MKLCGFVNSHFFIVIFIKVLSDRNQKYFQLYRIYSSSHNSLVPSVAFHYAKCPLGLYGAIHSQQCSMNAFQIFDYLFVHLGQFLIDSNGSIFIGLLALGCIRASATVFVYWSRFLVTLWSENNYFDLASIGVKYPLAECGLT